LASTIVGFLALSAVTVRADLSAVEGRPAASLIVFRPLGLLGGRSRSDHPSAQDPGELQRKYRNTPGTLGQDGVSCGDPAMARQCYPGGHCCAGQSGGLLEGQMAWQRHNCFFIEDRVFRQQSVEIGAEPVSQVVGLDRSAKPARMKATRNPVANFDPSNSSADRCDIAGARTAALRRSSLDRDHPL